MADYDYEIFISYRRMDDDWVRWTRDNLVAPLRSLLRPALGNVRIFQDEQIETGASWPAYLARALAHSKLLVPVLSRDYFNSDWCRLELALMHHREQQVGYRTPTNANVLILPFIIDDGFCFPPEVQAMQGNRIHDYANPWMRIDSPMQEKFAEHLRLFVPRIESAISTVPGFDTAWEGIVHNQFAAMFRIHVSTQKTLPPLSLLPIAPTPAMP
jgi:TIR domain